MRKLFVGALSFSLVSASAAFAMPVPSTDFSVNPQATRIADGCGPGRSRDAMGRCLHRFNRFDQFHRFRAYKQRHCTPMRTPNGMVNRCRI